MNSEQVLQNLIEETRNTLNQAEKLKSLDFDILNWKQNETSWNVLECLEHLNLYGNFYLPAIKNKIKTSNTKPEIEFKSGILGAYFSKIMIPKSKLNKMKTLKKKNPINRKLDKMVIHKFIQQQILLLELINKSRNVSLNKIKIHTSISSLISLKLGDTLQFLVNHNIRHLNQIDNILISCSVTIKNTL